MTATQDRLAKYIIGEHFGAIPKKVISCMLRQGRSTIPTLVQQSGVGPKLVRKALIILIHHHLVQHADILDGIRKSTFYEANMKEILNRTRIPRVIKAAFDQYGEVGKLIIFFALLNGRIQATQITKNIRSHYSSISEEEILETLTTMVSDRFMIAVSAEDAINRADKDISEREKAEEKFALPPTSAELKMLQQEKNVKNEMKMMDYSIVGLKRKANYEDPKQSKRQATDISKNVIDAALFWRVNFLKFEVLFRNMEVANFAQDCYNEGTGKLMSTILMAGEKRIRSCKLDIRTAAISLLMIQHLLDGSVELPVDNQGNDVPLTRQDMIKEYIELLSNDENSFLVKEDEKGSGQFVVNYSKVCTSLRKRLVETVIREKFGSFHLRIFRLLQTKGKLEDRQVSKFGLLTIQDAREKLYELAKHGFLQIQEVPRTPDYAPARTIYLFFVSWDHCLKTLRTGLFLTMSNLKQRYEYEMKVRHSLVAKTQRLDVIANPELLGDADKEALAEMDKVVDKLRISELRIDRMLMILNDFI